MENLAVAITGLIAVLLIIQHFRQQSCDERVEQVKREAERSTENRWKYFHQNAYQLYNFAVRHALKTGQARDVPDHEIVQPELGYDVDKDQDGIPDAMEFDEMRADEADALGKRTETDHS